MKKSRFSDSQILSILKQAEAGAPVPELCREHGMSSASFYKWRAKYGGMDASMVSRLKELEEDKPAARGDVCRASASKRRSARRLLRESYKAISASRDG